MVGIGATLGKVAHLPHPASTNQQVIAIKFNASKVLPNFGTHQLRCLEKHFMALAPKTTLPIMNQTTLGNIEMLVPDIATQENAVAQLMDADRQSSLIINEMKLMRIKLTTYRQSAITAAVTGQVTV